MKLRAFICDEAVAASCGLVHSRTCGSRKRPPSRKVLGGKFEEGLDTGIGQSCTISVPRDSGMPVRRRLD